MTGVDLENSGLPFAYADYGYDSNGNVVAEERSLAGGGTVYKDHTYDDLDRLAETLLDANGSQNGQTFDYSSTGNIYDVGSPTTGQLEEAYSYTDSSLPQAVTGSSTSAPRRACETSPTTWTASPDFLWRNVARRNQRRKHKVEPRRRCSASSRSEM